MKRIVLFSVVSVIGAFIVLVAGCESEPVTLWELKCASCHDGKTVLNDHVAPDREALAGKFSNMDQFMLSCIGGPVCMDSLKGDEELLRAVGREIGIPEG